MAQGTDGGARLMAFCAREFQQFFAHIGQAVATYQQTGTLPEHGYFLNQPVVVHAPPAAVKAEKADKGKVEKKNRVKRKPTAFNRFVQQKIAEFRAQGIKPAGEDKNNNAMFSLAVGEWKKLSEEQRAAYTEHFKAHDGEEVLLPLPVPEAVAVGAAAVVEDDEDEEEDDEDDESEEESSEEEDAPAPAPPVVAPPPAPAAPAAAEGKKRKADKGEAADKAKKKKEPAAPVPAPAAVASPAPAQEKEKKKKKKKAAEAQ